MFKNGTRCSPDDDTPGEQCELKLHHSFKRFEVHFVKASRILEGVKQFVGSLVWYMKIHNRLSVQDAI